MATRRVLVWIGTFEAQLVSRYQRGGELVILCGKKMHRTYKYNGLKRPLVSRYQYGITGSPWA